MSQLSDVGTAGTRRCRPPVCRCGLYAVGECVDSSLAVCLDHGAKVHGRFRCADHAAAARLSGPSSSVAEQAPLPLVPGWTPSDVVRWTRAGRSVSEAEAFAAQGIGVARALGLPEGRENPEKPSSGGRPEAGGLLHRCSVCGVMEPKGIFTRFLDADRVLHGQVDVNACPNCAADLDEDDRVVRF